MVTSRETARTSLLPGTLDMLVLKTLTVGALHGYGIARHIEQTSGDVLRVEEGSLYPALQRLQLQGWVTSEWEKTATSRRARFYRLTPAGRKRLQAEAREFDSMVAAIARVMQTT
jgi:PadR family transcriptional regulator PadR